MSRQKSTNVEYFPCYCKDGKTLYILESRWGNNGYAFFYKLWKRLGDADYHYIDLRPLDNWEYFRAKMGVSDAETQAILDKLAEMRVIDPELWSQKIIWSDSFIESIKEVWIKRKQIIPQKPLFLVQKPVILEQKDEQTGISGIQNPQSKVKESKVKKNKYISPPKTPLPLDFKISDRVKKWAAEKNYTNLEDHLEYFKLQCTSKDYLYVDWDSAFMKAIRDNWANIGGGNGKRANTYQQGDKRTTIQTEIDAEVDAITRRRIEREQAASGSNPGRVPMADDVPDFPVREHAGGT